MPEWLDSPTEWFVALILFYLGLQTLFALRHDQLCQNLRHDHTLLLKRVNDIDRKVETLREEIEGKG